ncbi:MAG: OmpW family outer membrane protein [Pseudomonadota bacterium]|uniref:OmpW/AlkL family protein n=1 Tax=Alcanivorax sp. TaxID=1872427 RepID=UPI0024396AC7|nr:OmpW family outer membrane protein [Alcanivorax sp.]MED5237974.1 OmpW family outer membrane protein [Pseudomonadota bacterium]MEE3319085.1 OmpW family outer membrane protein [Pseudomonadota bacterium]
MKTMMRSLLIPGLLCLSGGVAAEQDYYGPDYPGVSFIQKIFGEDRLYFRAGAMYQVPDVVTKSITLKNLSEIAEVAVEPGPQEGEAFSDPLLLPAVRLGYKLRWTLWGGGWSIETVAGLPPTLELKAKGKLADVPLVTEANGIPTEVPALGEKVAETKVAPPLFTLVKQFNRDSRLRPYVGLGWVYLFSYDSHVTNPVLLEVGEPELDIEDKFGWVGQVGLDYRISDYWWISADYKYISVTDVTATLEKAYIKPKGLPQYDYAEVGDTEFVADLNTHAFHLGIGFTF